MAGGIASVIVPAVPRWAHATENWPSSPDPRILPLENEDFSVWKKRMLAFYDANSRTSFVTRWKDTRYAYDFEVGPIRVEGKEAIIWKITRWDMESGEAARLHVDQMFTTLKAMKLSE